MLKKVHVICGVVQLTLDLVDSVSLEMSKSSAYIAKYIRCTASNAGVNA